MRWRIVWTICRKELLETVRDRRTVILMLFLPVVLYPLLLIGFSQIISHQMAKLSAGTGTVMIVGEAPNELLEKLESDESLRLVIAKDLPPRPPDFTIVETPPPARKNLIQLNRTPQEQLQYEPALRDWARDQLQARRIEVILILPKEFAANVAGDHTGTALIFFDETNEGALFVHGRLLDQLLAYRKDLLAARLQSRPELPEGFTRPLFFDSENVASAAKRGGYFAGRILPMMMIIMVMLGAFYPAVDLAAGEKERGTMQTLLTAPAQAIEIIFGKFITVFLVSLVSALANLGSLALALVYLLESGSVAGDLNFQLEWSTGLILLLQLIPVALLFSALMLAVSIFAKSFKEAQNYLTPLYLVVIIPVILSGLPGTTLSVKTAWLPILNITLLIKDLLVEAPPPQIIFMVLVANLLYSLLALVLAVRIFESEQVLLGGQGAFVDVIRVRTGEESKATPGLSVAALGLGLVVYFYLGGLMQQRHLAWGLVTSQFLLLFLPVLVICRALRFNFRETLSWRVPHPLNLLGVLLAGGTSFIVISRLGSLVQNAILRQPEPLRRLFEEQMGKLLGPDTPLLLALAAVAVTPAICEEIFFRGLILSGFRNGFGIVPAVILTSLCFGIYHLGIYVILPTAIIGLIVTGIVARSRSIANGMLYHLLHNGLTLLAVRVLATADSPGRRWFAWAEDLLGETPNWGKFALCAVIFVIGLVLACWSFTRPSPVELKA